MFIIWTLTKKSLIDLFFLISNPAIGKQVDKLHD